MKNKTTCEICVILAMRRHKIDKTVCLRLCQQLSSFAWTSEEGGRLRNPAYGSSSTEMMYVDIHRVSKNSQNCFCHNFVPNFHQL